MESYDLNMEFQLEGMTVQPVHVRVEKLRPVIASHRHSHTSYEIHYTAQGCGTVTVEGVRYPIREGLLYVTGPDVSHAQHSDPASPVIEYCLYLNCRLSGQKKRASPLCRSFLETKFWLGRDTENIFGVLSQLIREEKDRTFGHRAMTEALLRQIVVLMARTYQGRSLMSAAQTKEGFPSEARNYPQVEDAFFYGHKTLQLGELAELLHLSQRQTQRFLKEHYGMTFTQKRMEARMAAAAQMLAGTAMTIGEIAEQTGFSSGEHFSTAFHRYFHQSPSSYRKENRRNHEQEDGADED